MIPKFLFTVALFFVGISLSIGEEAPPPSVSAVPVETPKTGSAKSETGGKTRQEGPRALDQKGKIEKVDAAAGTFVIEGKVFTLAKKSRVEVDGNLMTLADLKEGDMVAVVYFAKTDGVNTVTRVIKGNAAKAKKKSKTTTATDSK